ncbi:MAG: alpha/beta fold hydrolase [Cellvibrionaceae bacterium]
MDTAESKSFISISSQPATIKRLSVPIVLIHGWGCDSKIWQPLLPFLSEWVDVLTVDIRYSEVSVDVLAEHIVTALPERFILCGWSLGGMLATRIAADFSEKASGLICLSTNLSFVEKPSWPTALPSKTFEQFYTVFDKNANKGLKRFLLLESHGDQSSKQQLQWLQQLQDESDLDLQSLLLGLKLLAGIDNSRCLSKIACPGLHLFGQNDALVPLKAVTLIEKMLNKNQQCVVFFDKGHVLHYPLNTIENELISFLSKVDVVYD